MDKEFVFPDTSVDDWERQRPRLLDRLQDVMGPLPGEERLCPLDVRVGDPERIDGVVRTRISYAPEPGDRTPAYLLTPENLQGKAPAMLCLHQTTIQGKAEPAGVAGIPNLYYGLELAQKGFVVLAPDYWFGPTCGGEYQPDPYGMGYASATMKGIWNHIRALDLLQSLPEVDPGRIGCIGHSLGGHNSLFLAAFDRRVRAVVTSCGFTAFAYYHDGDLTGWSHPGYMPRIASEYGLDPARMPFDFSDVLALAAPVGIFINAPLGDFFGWKGVDLAVQAALPVYGLFGAESAIETHHPDCEHDFPADIREKVYAFVAKSLSISAMSI
jgi:dienelactone hydrolase